MLCYPSRLFIGVSYFLLAGFGFAWEQPFETDAIGEHRTESAVAPWRVVVVDPEYGGHWVVVGDVNGDDELEVVAARNVDRSDNHYTSAVVAQRLDGSVLWRWGDATVGRRVLHHDVGCQIHDLDQDGANEVIVAAERQLIVLNGGTGEVEASFPIPEHASDCVTFADLRGQGWPSDILVKNRYEQMWAYTGSGEPLWTVRMPGAYRTAHQPLPVDLDGDGRDEVLAGYAALNGDGSVRWVFELEPGAANGGHADCWRVVRLSDDPADTRLVLTMCGGNALVMTDGHGRPLWRQVGHHYESVDVGKLRADLPGEQIVVDVDHLPKPPKPLCVFDEQGQLLGRIETSDTRHHMLVDWNGDGLHEIGSAVPHALFDGRGERVVTFAIGGGEKPLLMDAVDFDGGEPDGVLLTTVAPNDDYKVYLYRPVVSLPESAGRPQGTGRNYTLY